MRHSLAEEHHDLSYTEQHTKEEYMVLKKTDLHVHLLQSLYPQDVFELGKDHYRAIDWNRFDFLNRYEDIVGVRLTPVEMFERGLKTGLLDDIDAAMVFREDEAGDFEKFDIRSFFPLCVTGYYLDQNDHNDVMAPIVERHKKEGISYIEYRNGVGYSDDVKEEWKDWHRRFITYLKSVSDRSFQAKYIMRISENMYGAVREFVREHPDLLDVFVGLDFTGRELPPKSHKAFYKQLYTNNARDPMNALDMVVHIGEDFFDKSLESAIRWCHETAEYGVKRLAHCIALGLDPEIAIARRPNAHTEERVSERLDQIGYDLVYAHQLRERGINVDRGKLLNEKDELMQLHPDEIIRATYDETRLAELRARQNFVIDKLRAYGTVIEVCPTSNLRIGGIPAIEYHPFKKFYDSGLNIAICTDDPGIFKKSLSDEVDFITKAFHLDRDELVEHIGDPYAYRLGQSH